MNRVRRPSPLVALAAVPSPPSRRAAQRRSRRRSPPPPSDTVANVGELARPVPRRTTSADAAARRRREHRRVTLATRSGADTECHDRRPRRPRTCRRESLPDSTGRPDLSDRFRRPDDQRIDDVRLPESSTDGPGSSTDRSRAAPESSAAGVEHHAGVEQPRHRDRPVRARGGCRETSADPAAQRWLDSVAEADPDDVRRRDAGRRPGRGQPGARDRRLDHGVDVAPLRRRGVRRLSCRTAGPSRSTPRRDASSTSATGCSTAGSTTTSTSPS